MHALRLARCATGRDKIIKFEGHFHGYTDALNFSVAPPLDQAGPARTPCAYPESAGAPASARQDIVIVPFNEPQALEEAFAAHGRETAALVLEPINYDQGCILPQPGFLQLCRDLCDRYGVVLFYDEVLTAFRMAPGGAQQYLGVTPDLCVLGKAFGGGLPISAVAGQRAIMQHLRPLGRSEMSGTYLSHPTAVLAALAALDEYSRPGFYERLQAVGEYFYTRFQTLIERSGVPVRLQYVGPRFGMYFGVRDEVTNYRQAACKDRALEHAFLAGCFRRGVYFAVSPHHGFSAAHTPADMDRVLAAVAGAGRRQTALRPSGPVEFDRPQVVRAAFGVRDVELQGRGVAGELALQLVAARPLHPLVHGHFVLARRNALAGAAEREGTVLLDPRHLDARQRFAGRADGNQFQFDHAQVDVPPRHLQRLTAFDDLPRHHRAQLDRRAAAAQGQPDRPHQRQSCDPTHPHRTLLGVWHRATITNRRGQRGTGFQPVISADRLEAYPTQVGGSAPVPVRPHRPDTTCPSRRSPR